MFKVGDVIVNKKFRKERYTILEIHSDRNSIVIEPFPDIIDVVAPFFIGIDTLYNYWDYDDVYYRKLKLEKICCSKKEIK